MANIVNAQDWLEEKHKDKLIKEIKYKKPKGKFWKNQLSDYAFGDGKSSFKESEGSEESEDNFLKGELVIEGYSQLEIIYLEDNEITKLIIRNCPLLKELICSNNKLKNIFIEGECNKLEKIYCVNNYLKETNFLKRLSKPEFLKELMISNNNFNKQNLQFLEPFVDLEVLSVGNRNQNKEKLEKNVYNKFHGSLKYLKNMKKLELLGISSTDIDSGLEYLPDSLQYIYCQNEDRKESKVIKIEEEVAGYCHHYLKNDLFIETRIDIKRAKTESKLKTEKREQYKTLLSKINSPNTKEKRCEIALVSITELLTSYEVYEKQLVETREKLNELDQKFQNSYESLEITQLKEELNNLDKELNSLDKELNSSDNELNSLDNEKLKGLKKLKEDSSNKICSLMKKLKKLDENKRGLIRRKE